MSNQKVIFLDIDGTLTDFGGKIPESAKKALTLAKQAGHRLGAGAAIRYPRRSGHCHLTE